MTTRRVFRYVVPIDHGWHRHGLTGPVLAVAARRLDELDFWAVHTEDAPVTLCEFRVFATGALLPTVGQYRFHGTAVDHDGAYVWHLIGREVRR